MEQKVFLVFVVAENLSKKIGFHFWFCDTENRSGRIKYSNLGQVGAKRRKEEKEANEDKFYFASTQCPSFALNYECPKKEYFSSQKVFFYQRRKKGKVRELVSEKELNNVARVCTFLSVFEVEWASTNFCCERERRKICV